MERDRKFTLPKIKLAADFWVVTVNILLLVPGVIFWTSVLMYATLGTDYVFDVVLENLNKSWWGNVLITILVMGGPAMVVAISGLELVKTKNKNKKMKWMMAIGLTFLIMSFLAVLKKM